MPCLRVFWQEIGFSGNGGGAIRKAINLAAIDSCVDYWEFYFPFRVEFYWYSFDELVSPSGQLIRRKCDKVAPAH